MLRGCGISWVSPLLFLYKSLRKHAYSNILKILPPKNEHFQIKKKLWYFSYFCSIGCGYSLEPPRRGGSNEYPQSMFSSRNKKNNVYPCKPQFYNIKVGLRGSKLYRYVFVMYITKMPQNVWRQQFLTEHKFSGNGSKMAASSRSTAPG